MCLLLNVKTAYKSILVDGIFSCNLIKSFTISRLRNSFYLQRWRIESMQSAWNYIQGNIPVLLSESVKTQVVESQLQASTLAVTVWYLFTCFHFGDASAQDKKKKHSIDSPVEGGCDSYTLYANAELPPPLLSNCKLSKNLKEIKVLQMYTCN